MRSVGFSIGVLVLLLFPAVVFAVPADNEGLKQYCLDKMGISIRQGEINFVFETQHDPKLHLVRRCITEERKKMINEKRVERQQLRETARFRRSSEKAQKLRRKVEGGVNKALRRKNVKREQFRSPTQTLNPDVFREGRRTRRSLIRQEEGADRINAIRRRLMRSNLPDPCKSVTVISETAPCGNPTQYFQLKRRGVPAWYRRR